MGSSDNSVEKWEKNSEEMKNSIFILLYLFLPDAMLNQSETTTPTTTSESSCRRNMKVMLQSIFQEYESNSAICTIEDLEATLGPVFDKMFQQKRAILVAEMEQRYDMLQSVL